MSQRCAIAVSDLTKCYDKKLLAVDHISFNVEKGEIFGFLGPNGAGKTTTINMLTGLTKPTSGTASISSFDIINKSSDAKGKVGVVPATSFLYDEMTAWDNIIFSAKLHSVPKAKRLALAHDLLNLFGLYERRNCRVGTFSGGMKKRLMIATALIHEPETLFLDEPTAGLDVQSARQIREIIKELNKKGTTVFLTTHYIEEADQLCQRIAIINKGKIIALDTPQELKATINTGTIFEVTFDRPDGVVEELKKLSFVQNVAVKGTNFRLTVTDSAESLPLLVRFVEKKHVKITSINTVTSTLEDAFVKLTGLDSELMSIENMHIKPQLRSN